MDERLVALIASTVCQTNALISKSLSCHSPTPPLSLASFFLFDCNLQCMQYWIVNLAIHHKARPFCPACCRTSHWCALTLLSVGACLSLC